MLTGQVEQIVPVGVEPSNKTIELFVFELALVRLVSSLKQGELPCVSAPLRLGLVLTRIYPEKSQFIVLEITGSPACAGSVNISVGERHVKDWEDILFDMQTSNNSTGIILFIFIFYKFN